MSRQRSMEVIRQAEYVTIGELVRLTDVRYSTLKFYTEQGLLPFEQAEQNLTRRYRREESVERIELLRRLREEGKSVGDHLRGGAQPLREQVVRLGSSLRPAPGRDLCKDIVPAPTFWALRPKPRVTFVSRRKSPKACRGCAPGPPWGALSSPQRRCRSPQKDSPIGHRGRCGLVLPSAPDRGLGLPIAFPLFRKKLLRARWGAQAVHSR